MVQKPERFLSAASSGGACVLCWALFRGLPETSVVDRCSNVRLALNGKDSGG